MTETKQKQLGNTLWAIADQLRGAMDADDFRDCMLSFLFLRYLSDNHETAATQTAKDMQNRFLLELGLKPLP
jgi:type I restriction enzyme M protein